MSDFQFHCYDVDGLTEYETAVLAADIRAVAEDEGFDDYADAEAEHYRRVGGQTNLRSYVDCLMVGEIRS